MKVFKDYISGDEFFSDSFPHEYIFNGACIEAKAKYVVKGKELVLIATDEEEEDQGEGETVIDIQDKFELNEVQNYTKAEFMTWAKAYLGKLKARLTEENANLPEDKQRNLAEFQAGATQLVKLIAGKFSEMQIFCGSKMDYEGAFCFAYTKEQTDEGPTFLYFADGLKGVKY